MRVLLDKYKVFQLFILVCFFLQASSASISALSTYTNSAQDHTSLISISTNIQHSFVVNVDVSDIPDNDIYEEFEEAEEDDTEQKIGFVSQPRFDSNLVYTNDDVVKNFLLNLYSSQPKPKLYITYSCQRSFIVN